MRKVRAWGVAAAVALGFGATMAVAGEESTPGASPGASAWAPTWRWKPFAAWFATKEEKKPAEKTPAPKPAPTATKSAPPSVKPASLMEEAAAQRSRAEAALLRRLQACDKLKEIAIRTNDNELLRRAEELEERAQTTYAQRTAHLQGTAGGFESDEKTIDRYLGASPARAEEPPAYVVTSKAHSSQAAAKEVKP